jgi:hypothetical protein
LLDAARNAISMQFAHGFKRLQDHQGQCALPNVIIAHVGSYLETIGEYIMLILDGNREMTE